MANKMNANEIGEIVKSLAQANVSYEDAFVMISWLFPSDPQQFMLMESFAHWEWETAGGPPLTPARRDELCRAAQAGTGPLIQKQILEAHSWAEDLKAAGLSPAEALGSTMPVLENVAEKEKFMSEVTKHPAAIGIPLMLLKLQGIFYQPADLSKRNILRPIEIAASAILSSPLEGEEMAQVVAGQITAFMVQCHHGTAKGKALLPIGEQQQAISIFSVFMVHHILKEKFKGGKAYFASKEWNLIVDAVWALYLAQQ